MALKKKPKAPEEVPSWLVTFSDVMTLLLAFFVLLVSMSTIDQRKKLDVLGSVSASFSFNEFQSPLAVLSRKDKLSTKTPGAMEDVNDLEELKNIALDEQLDLDFKDNKNIQILSINQNVLFQRGETKLSQRGKAFFGRIAPILIQLDFPLLIAGHTASLRDETGEQADPSDRSDKTSSNLDPTWLISLQRTRSVYEFLISKGIPKEKLLLESFGKYRPSNSNQSVADRQKNRRVDLVLDKRNGALIKQVDRIRGAGQVPDSFSFKEFQFDLSGPQDKANESSKNQNEGQAKDPTIAPNPLGINR